MLYERVHYFFLLQSLASLTVASIFRSRGLRSFGKPVGNAAPLKLSCTRNAISNVYLDRWYIHSGHKAVTGKFIAAIARV